MANRFLQRWLLTAIVLLLHENPASAQLTIRVTSNIPKDAVVYVAGTFNNWNPAAPRYQLAPQSAGEYTITLPDTVRGPIEFKFTLGSWQAVETDSARSDIANRTFTIPAVGAATYNAVVPGWRDPATVHKPAHSATASVSILRPDFKMPQLGRTRRIWLYLPPDYTTTKKSYPVLYMHDGQNVFDAATGFAGEWGVDETLDSLHAHGDRGVIVVAIDNGEKYRLNEYSPWVNARYGGGQGDAYVDFLVKSLKPYIDRHYRTRPDRSNTGVAGSSMGGLISLYAALKYPAVFGRVGVFSPALWFAPDLFAFARKARLLTPHPRLYFVSGARESQVNEEAGVYMRLQRAMVDTLAASGLQVGPELASLVQPDGVHAEWFWRREFPAAYKWLFTADQAVADGPALPASAAREWERLAAAEDARAATAAQLQWLVSLTHSPNAELRRLSVRSLGRLERTDLADTIARALHDPAPAVRAQAASALAQANAQNRTPSPNRDTIAAAIATEQDAAVMAALAETMGRLRQPDVIAARATVAALIKLLDRGPVVRLGALRGLQFILRQPAPIRPALDTARAALIRAATAQDGLDTTSLRARRLATQILASARLGDEATALRILTDPDPLVRRDAMLFASTADTAAARRVTMSGLRDPFWLVRYEALRQYGRRFGGHGSCAFAEPYVRDANMHIRLAALDLLRGGCSARAETTVLLDSIVLTLPADGAGDWHPAAHALVSLAAHDAAHARKRMQPFIVHPNLFVRAYAALAAGIARDTIAVRHLTNDAHPNVRMVAVQSLSTILGHAADSVYVAQLGQDDSQLLMAVTAALDSTTTPNIAPKLLDALDRLTKLQSENSRDGRDALLRVAGRLGSVALIDRVRPYLRDFDPAIANRAADVIKAWTGVRPDPVPQVLPLEPTPSFEEAMSLAKARVTLDMMNGDTIRLRLRPFDAPTNAARFARLARAGYFDGLTLHRVEPNFVVQGGSANANEYRGAPRFSRDEIGGENWRGTIGLSTRGHDTGDAQFFINMIDNSWLDPFYTVFAEVVVGMDAVDRMLEGATIRQVRIREVSELE